MLMTDQAYVIGIDFGTDSVRSIVVDVKDGKELASTVVNFRRWKEGKYCDPSKNQFRQHPLDYIEGLEQSVNAALARLPEGSGEHVIGIGVDTTGSTPAPVDREGTVLALRDEFKDNPNAMFILWKDHTAVNEADEINEAARSWGGTDFTKYVGGVYSSEWFWAKILHVLRTDREIAEAAFSWVEHADWVPAILTGNTDPLVLQRNRCAAGHKAMWHKEWGGLPPEEFLVKVDPLLKGLRERLYTDTVTSDKKAGVLTSEWADRLGLKEGTAVAVGAFDAHMGAVGTEVKEKSFVMILGTSACDMAVAPYEIAGDKLVDGICGQVDGSIIPGMIGLEAGQSGFGDVYAWFRSILSWPLESFPVENTLIETEKANAFRDEIGGRIIDRLSEEALKLDIDKSLIALDWLNGRRTPYADQKLKGAVAGITLGTTAVKLFRALVESTAYGARAIVERFIEEGIEIEEVVASGGIPKKAPFVMQVLSDVLNMPVKVAESEQAPSLGAAMFAAVAAGAYGSVYEAQKRMGSGFATTFFPDPLKAKKYDELYKRYKEIGSLLEEQLRQ
jgi:L-ribulokinase